MTPFCFRFISEGGASCRGPSGHGESSPEHSDCRRIERTNGANTTSNEYH